MGVDPLVIADGKLSLRRLGERDAQEPGGPSLADPTEGRAIKIYFGRRTIAIAETISNVERGLFLDNKKVGRCSEGEKCLVREQGRDKANKPHVGETNRLIGDGISLGMRGGGLICADRRCSWA